jgi:hypothetical protein
VNMNVLQQHAAFIFRDKRRRQQVPTFKEDHNLNNHSYENLKIHTQNYWDFGLCPSSGMLKAREHDISGTGSGSVLR